MNPGLLRQLVFFQRQTADTDELGQRLDEWETIGRCFARRKPVNTRARTETVIADRDTEKQTMVFQMRSRPFVSIYQAGDRLVEAKRVDFPETAWRVIGWAEVEGTNGMYVEVTAEIPAKR